MYKQHLLQNIERELVLLKRLAASIEEKDLAFKPAENVRTTHELMQYLSGMGSITVRWIIKNDLSPEDRAKIREQHKNVSIADFPSRLDQQWENIQQLINELKEEDLLSKEAELPWKEKMPLGAALMNGPVKWLATYRMQLFLNLKINGKSALQTRDAWVP